MSLEKLLYGLFHSNLQLFQIKSRRDSQGTFVPQD